MTGDLLSSGISAAISGYESIIGMFGSPAVLIAITGVLIVVAIVELYVRKCSKRAKEAV